MQERTQPTRKESSSILTRRMNRSGLRQAANKGRPIKKKERVGKAGKDPNNVLGAGHVRERAVEGRNSILKKIRLRATGHMVTKKRGREGHKGVPTNDWGEEAEDETRQTSTAGGESKEKSVRAGRSQCLQARRFVIKAGDTNSKRIMVWSKIYTQRKKERTARPHERMLDYDICDSLGRARNIAQRREKKSPGERGKVILTALDDEKEGEVEKHRRGEKNKVEGREKKPKSLGWKGERNAGQSDPRAWSS